MKFRVEPTLLADAVTWTAKALPNRPTVPVLAGVLLRVADGQLTIAGFDYEVSNQVTLSVEGAEDGVALVSGRLLAEITKALPGKPVDMATAGAHLELVCGAGRFTLPTMPAEDYPAMPAMPSNAGTIDAAVFAEAVAQVAVAAGRDDTLPMMTGVRVELNGSTLAMLATDRYRLALREIPWTPDDPGIDATALVPARTLHDTAKALGQTGGTVTLALARGAEGAGTIGFSTEARNTTSRLLDNANYPPVRSLFPAADTITAEARVPTAALIEVVKRVSLVGGRTTPVLLSFSSDGLVVEAGGVEEARASEGMDATFTGEPLTIGFNPQYLVDGLATIGAPVALFTFVSAIKPAVLLPAHNQTDPPDPGHRYLMMPIRVTR